MYKNSLIKKTRLISNFLAPQPGEKTLSIRIFPNFLGSKDLKFGQLLEYNMSNIFLEKSRTK